MEQEQLPLTSENFPTLMKIYGDQFNNSRALEEVIPREITSEVQLKQLSNNTEYTKETGNDLLSLTKSISEPVWDLLDRGGKRWRPILCVLIAEAFGKT